MNIYHFSENWHRDGLEPSLFFFLIETSEKVRLTFPTWKNLVLQNILRFVKDCNAKNSFNTFRMRSLLQNPKKISTQTLTECECSFPNHDPSDESVVCVCCGEHLNSTTTCKRIRQIPTLIYNYLIDNGLAFDRDPQPITIKWVDHSRYISDEDIYRNMYDGGDHFYFEDFYRITDIINKQPEHVKELLSSLESCRCGCKLHVRMSELGYTTLHCMNPYCPVKLPFVLADIAKRLGVLGIGSVVFEATVWSIFCDNIKRTGLPYVRLKDVLNEQYFLQFNSLTGEKMQDLWEKITEFSGPLSELIKMSSLPYIGEIAADIFSPKLLEDSVTDFSKFWKIMKGGKVKSLRVAFIIWLYLADIKHLTQCTKAKLKDAEIIVYIAITGGVRYVNADGSIIKFANKQEYVDEINRALRDYGLGDQFRFSRKTKLTHNCMCLINDSGMTGLQNSDAKEWGIPIIKSTEIFKLLREVYYD